MYTDRDNFPDHDFVGLVLDTFNDERRSYDFYCNPLGIQTDGSETPQGWVEWDAIWNSAGRITGDGYIVEMAIPFSSLHTVPAQKRGPGMGHRCHTHLPPELEAHHQPFSQR